MSLDTQQIASAVCEVFVDADLPEDRVFIMPKLRPISPNVGAPALTSGMLRATYNNLNRGGTWSGPAARDDSDSAEDNLREAMLRAQLADAKDKIVELEGRLRQSNDCLLDSLTDKFFLKEQLRILRTRGASH